jgi:hypothetical protein
MASAKAYIVWRDRTLDVELNQRAGMVGRHLHKRGTMVQNAAKMQAGVQTGALKASINMVHERTMYGQMLTIGSTLSYALAHHNGTRPHIITPKNAKMLRFTQQGRVVYARAVRHPGTKPNRYLADNLYLIL